MRLAWKINGKALRYYMIGLHHLNKSKTYKIKNDHISNEPVFMKYFRKAIEITPNNRNFRLEIVHRLLEKGYSKLASGLLSESGITITEQLLVRADQLVKAEQFNDAEKILFHLSRNHHGLPDYKKAKILYLLGRICRAKNLSHRAARYFRISARYSSDRQVSRRKVLAAYTLYRQRLPLQAMALFRSMPPSEDKKIILFRLILRSEVDGDSDALRKLKRMKKTLIKLKRKSKSRFLVNRALLIIRQNQ